MKKLFSKEKQSASKTLEILKDGIYETSNGAIFEIENSSTIYYKPNSILEYSSLKPEKVSVFCTEEDSLTAAKKYKNPCVLNFASAKNPGGGWLNGAIAQEEAITRCSTLYSSLLEANKFYIDNVVNDDSLYTEAIIYSKNIMVIKDSKTEELCEPWFASIITCAAPNLTNWEPEVPLPTDLFFKRMLKVLQVAAVNQHETVVLGAWGTGVFKWPVDVVAKLWFKAISQMNFFKNVIMPLPDANKRAQFIGELLKTNLN